MKSNDWTTDLLKLVFHNVTCPLLGDGVGLVGSSVAGNLYVSLHTADPGRSGAQTKNEANYSGYTRVAVPRSSARWAVSLIDTDIGPVRVSNATLVAFPEATGGENRITYAAVGTSASGAGKMLYSGKLVTQIPVVAGIIPEFRIGDLSLTES